MARAKWTTKAQEIKTATSAEGTFTASLPLYDNNVKAATLQFAITADRVLRVEVVNEQGAAGLAGFTAWSREG